MTKSFKTMWPCPVYVATFADGTVGRMSFASKAGKPIEFDRGRNLVAWAFAQNVPQNPRDSMRAPRHDIVGGLVERHTFQRDTKLHYTRNPRPLHQHLPIGMRGTLRDRGLASHEHKVIETFVDPHFAPSNVIPLPKREHSSVAKTLAAVAKALGVEVDDVRALIAEAA